MDGTQEYKEQLELDNLALLQNITAKQGEITCLKQQIAAQEEKILALQRLILEQEEGKTQQDIRNLRESIDQACPRMKEKKERSNFYHIHKTDTYVVEEAKRRQAQQPHLPLWKMIRMITDQLYDTQKQHNPIPS